jgi:glycosyltransferase involved in cell wall biosynthesis
VREALEGRKVALVFATSTGGVGRHVHSLTRGLVTRGARVTVLGDSAAEELFAFSAAGADFRPVDIDRQRDPRRDLRAVRELRVATNCADLIHAHGLRASAITGLATPRRTPFVTTWHNAVLGSARRRHGYAVLERWIARRADIVLGASADLVDRARRFGARRALLGPVAAPPLPPAQRDPSSVRAELGAGERPLVLTVGRLSKQKRLDVLIDAAVLLGKRDPVPVVAVAGSGPVERTIADRVRETRAPMTLLGHREDVADLLAAADIVVLPSAWEARPLAAQEALRAGRPLVATAVGGVPDLVGDAAVLVPPGDARVLADAIAALLDDRARRERLAAAGPLRAATWPDEDAAIAIVTGVYADVLGARP